MSKTVTEANAAELFVLACRHSAHSLKKSVSKFIQENMERVESTEGMKKLDREHLIEILKLARRRKWNVFLKNYFFLFQSRVELYFVLNSISICKI